MIYLQTTALIFKLIGHFWGKFIGCFLFLKVLILTFSLDQFTGINQVLMKNVYLYITYKYHMYIHKFYSW